MAAKKLSRVKHLNDIPARVHLKSGGLKVSVTIPWKDLEERLGISLSVAEKKFRKSVKPKKAETQTQAK